MGKAKITVTIEQTLVEELDHFAVELKENRSQLVEKALILWRQKRLEQELIEGYRAMAKEDIQTAEENLVAGFEVLT